MSSSEIRIKNWLEHISNTASSENRRNNVLEQMFIVAVEPFSTERGTQYPCTQSELDFHRIGRFTSRNKGPFVSALEATAEIMRQNCETRVVPPAELEALNRLLDVVPLEYGYKYGPDLAIKAFADLDLVFFGGRLHGNVCIRWSTPQLDSNLHELQNGNPILGYTNFPLRSESGQTRIVLNAKAHFLGQKESPFKHMICCLLHEMCHAFSSVRCSVPDGGHGQHFQTRVSIIHQRAVEILGMHAMHGWEHYVQHHVQRMDNGKCVISGTDERQNGSIKDDGRLKSDGHVRNDGHTRSDGRLQNDSHTRSHGRVKSDDRLERWLYQKRW